MGILAVLHTFGSDLKWHVHVHLIVTGGGLILDNSRWTATGPRFLMHEGGLKKRWKSQIVTRMKQAHRQGQWRFFKSLNSISKYPGFAAILNKL